MPRLHTFVSGESLLALSTAFAEAMRDRTHTRKPSGSGIGADDWPDAAGNGGHHVLIVAPKLLRPAAGVTTRVLDSAIDWRDRLLLVAGAMHTGGDVTAVYPGHAEDDEFDSLVDSLGARFISDGYTRLGTTVGATTGDTIVLDPTWYVRLRADQSTGALMVDHATGSPNPVVSLILRIWASERLGQRLVAPPRVPLLTASDGQPIAPSDLNVLQDAALLRQARSDVRETTDPQHVAIDAMPLGPAGRGDPFLPELWTVRGAERRQPTVGEHRRFFAEEIPTADEVLVDDTIDWRDRLLWGMGRQSTTDFRPGQTDDTDHNDDAIALPWEGACYTGPGEPIAAIVDPRFKLILQVSDIALIVSDEGKLFLRNDSGSTIFVTGMVEASFPLGPRTTPQRPPVISPLLRLADGTFSRASAGAYRDGSAYVYASAGVDVRRFDNWDDGWGPQLLIEGEATNLEPESNDLADWPTTSNLRGRTDDYEPGPLAASYGSRMVSDGAGTTNSVTRTGIAIAAATAYCWSVFRKAGAQNTGGHDNSIQLDDGTVVTDLDLGAPGSSWGRSSVVHVTDAGATVISERLGIDPSGAGAAADGDDLVVWGIQLELGRFATTPVETDGGTATRSADLLTFTLSQVPPQLRDGRARFDVWPIWAYTSMVSGDSRVLLSFGGASDVLRFRHDGTGVLVEAVVGGVVQAESQYLEFTLRTFLRIAWSADLGRIRVDGADAGSGLGPVGTAWVWPSAAVRVGGTFGATDGAVCCFGDIWAVAE